jgi:hypothetical protein
VSTIFKYSADSNQLTNFCSNINFHIDIDHLMTLYLKRSGSNNKCLQWQSKNWVWVQLTLIGTRIIKMVKDWHQNLQHITALQYIIQELLK